MAPKLKNIGKVQSGVPTPNKTLIMSQTDELAKANAAPVNQPADASPGDVSMASGSPKSVSKTPNADESNAPAKP